MESKEKQKEELEELRIELGQQEMEESARNRDEVYTLLKFIVCFATENQKETRAVGCF